MKEALRQEHFVQAPEQTDAAPTDKSPSKSALPLVTMSSIEKSVTSSNRSE